MPENPIFTPMLAKIEVSNVRRVTHSLTNWFQSIDRSSFSVSNITGQSLGAFGNASGTLGLVAGVATVAGSSIATGAFLAACAGPQVAITAGVAGIVMFAKSAYSNRDQAHQVLSQYIWNLVDDQPPPQSLSDPKNLAKAADAALTLLNDGQSQLKLLPKKMETATARFNTFHTSLAQIEAEITTLNNRKASAVRNPSQMALIDKELQKKKASLREKLEKSMKDGGELFEYVRRLSHTGNYIQAPLVVAYSIKVSAEGGNSQSPSAMQTDYFANSPLAQSRQLLMDYAALYQRLMTL